MTNRRLLFTTVALLLLALLLGEVWLSADAAVSQSWLAQTIPSRTPTPSTQPTNTPAPTNTPGPGPGPTNTPRPGATNTPIPGATATNTPPPQIFNTPVGGFLATAEPCGLPPTFQALGPTNVRRGPGLDYAIVDGLAFLQVRPIVGRAAAAEWWLIGLPDGQTGWVADLAGTVHGYTGLVPLIDPPPLNGNTPTPGPAWQPTPNPICTVVPTPTTTGTPRDTPAPSATATAVPSDTPAPTNTAAPTATATAVPTAAPAVESGPTPTAAPLESGGAGANPDWLLVGGVVLVLLGIILTVLRRRPGVGRNEAG